MNNSVADCNSVRIFEGDRLSCSMNDEGTSNVQKTEKVKQKDVAEKDPPVSQKIKRFVEPGPRRRGIRVSEVWPILSKGKKKGEPVTWDDLDAYVESLASKKKRHVGKAKKASGADNAVGGGDNVPPPGEKDRKGKTVILSDLEAAAGCDNVPPPPPPPPSEEAEKGKRVRWADLEAAGGGDNVPPPPPPDVETKNGKRVRWADLEAAAGGDNVPPPPPGEETSKQIIKIYSSSEEDSEDDRYYLMKNGKDFYYYNTGPDCEEQPDDEDAEWKP